MTKLDKFTASLDVDLGWRKKEVSNTLLLHNNENELIIVKASLLMIYSHWEGFVKNACKLYLTYISDLSLELNDLCLNFEAIKLKGDIRELKNSCDTLTMSNELSFIEFIYDNKKKLFKLPNKFTRNEKNKDFINTKDNLSFNVYLSFLKIVGIGERDSIVTRNHFIDEKLLNNRNKIAHGNKIDSINDDFDQTIDDVKKTRNVIFSIMDSLSEDLKHYAENELYLYRNDLLSNAYNVRSDARLESLLKSFDN